MFSDPEEERGSVQQPGGAELLKFCVATTDLHKSVNKIYSVLTDPVSNKKLF